MMANTILLMAKNVGLRMGGLPTYTLFLQRLMVTNSAPSSSNEGLKDSRKDLKNIKWELKDLPQYNCISRTARCRLKIFWAKLVKDMSLPSTYLISGV